MQDSYDYKRDGCRRLTSATHVVEPETVDVKSDIDIGFMPDIESKPLRLKKRK